MKRTVMESSSRYVSIWRLHECENGALSATAATNERMTQASVDSERLPYQDLNTRTGSTASGGDDEERDHERKSCVPIAH